VECLEAVLSAMDLEGLLPELSFFEVAVLAAFLHFKQEKVRGPLPILLLPGKDGTSGGGGLSGPQSAPPPRTSGMGEGMMRHEAPSLQTVVLWAGEAKGIFHSQDLWRDWSRD